MKKFILITQSLVFLIFTTSCGTITARDTSETNKMLYPATQTDVVYMYACLIEEPILFPAGLLFLVDLPISLITDTVCLPVDLRNKQKKLIEPDPENKIDDSQIKN